MSRISFSHTLVVSTSNGSSSASPEAGTETYKLAMICTYFIHLLGEWGTWFVGNL